MVTIRIQQPDGDDRFPDHLKVLLKVFKVLVQLYVKGIGTEGKLHLLADR